MQMVKLRIKQLTFLEENQSLIIINLILLILFLTSIARSSSTCFPLVYHEAHYLFSLSAPCYSPPCISLYRLLKHRESYKLVKISAVCQKVLDSLMKKTA